MDMPVKVLFKWNNYYQSFQKEVKLYPPGKMGFSEVSIKEFDSISVILECEDPQARLEMERFDTAGVINIKPGEEYLLTEGGDLENTLVPGYYPIIVRTSSALYKSLYKIEPRNISDNDLENLRKYLEKILTGLSYNLLNKRVGIYRTDEIDNYSLFMEMYQVIKRYYRKLIRDLEDLLKNPLTDVRKEYKKRPFSKKPDQKSFRWLVKKGITRNANSWSPSIFYEKHATLTVDIFENRWLKQNLTFVQYILRQLEKIFRESCWFLEIQYEKKVRELQNEKIKYEHAYNKWYIKKSAASIKALEKDTQELKHKLARMEKDWLELRRMYFTFLRYENESWLKKIGLEMKNQKPSFKILKDRRYANFYRFYQELRKIQRKEVCAGGVYFPFKKTSLLFEYYVLCILIRILEEEGFEWYAGWLADRENPFLEMGTLLAGTVLKFQKNGFIIELAYDYELKDLETCHKSYFIPGKANRPDYRLSIYNPEGVLVKTLILDAKYRRFKYLYDENGDTDVMRQLKDYLDIKYYCKETERMDHVVHKVIAVYPQDNEEEDLQCKFHKRIVFVQLNPVDPDLEVDPYGFNNLKKQVIEFIDEFLEKNNIY